MEPQTPQNIIPEPYTEPPKVPVHHHHITPWVALVIIAAIAATAGYLIWAKAHEAWPFDYDGPWSEVKRGPSTSLGTTGDYAGWKTYRNEEYGFEFRYPNNAEFKNTTEISAQINPEIIHSVHIRTDEGYISDVIVLHVQNSKSALLEAYKDSVVYNANSDSFIRVLSEDFNNLSIQVAYFCSEGIMNSNICNSSLNGDKSKIIVLKIFQKDNKTFIFKSYANNKYLDQILSTFKFID